MTLHSKKILLVASAALLFTACKKDKDPVFVINNSSGAQVELNGITSAGEAGGSAGNSVYLDLSSDKTTTALRSGWDLGFYSGPEFRVIINNTSSAGAKVLAKNDLTQVDETDTIGLTLSVNQFNPLPSDLVYFDDINGNITSTVIPAASANDASNNVVIINRGAGGGITARPWMKIRVLRNATGGYTLQYARIKETTFQTLTVPKSDDYHFTFVSFDKGIVAVEPPKENWDIVWSYSLFHQDFGAGLAPYNFADMIAVNHLSNVQVRQRTYATEAIATAAYDAFNRDSVNANPVAPGRWTIGSGWRSTQPATGARRNIFYVIKDPAGNYYKFRCLSMGVGSDGETRGKPVFAYKLIP